MAHGHAHGGGGGIDEDPADLARYGIPPASRKSMMSRSTKLLLLLLAGGGLLPLIAKVVDMLPQVRQLVYPSHYNLDITNSKHIASVFKAADEPPTNWLIVCHANTTAKNMARIKPEWWPTITATAEAVTALAATPTQLPFKVGLLDCHLPLPTNKQSLMQRFPQIQPTYNNLFPPMFFTSPQHPTPQMIPTYTYQNFAHPTKFANQLAKHLRTATTIQPKLIASNTELHTHCLKQRTCALIVNKSGKLQLDQASRTNEHIIHLMREYRQTSFVQLDGSKYGLTLFGSKGLPEVEFNVLQEWPRIVVFSRTLQPQEGEMPAAVVKPASDNTTDAAPTEANTTATANKTTPIAAKVHRGLFDFDNIAPLLKDMTQSSTKTTSLGFKPAFLATAPRLNSKPLARPARASTKSSSSSSIPSMDERLRRQEERRQARQRRIDSGEMDEETPSKPTKQQEQAEDAMPDSFYDDGASAAYDVDEEDVIELSDDDIDHDEL